VRQVPGMARLVSAGMLGIGIGGTAEKAVLLAKESLMQPIDMHELQARGPQDRLEELRLEIYDKVNALGIGAQGLGGLTTVLDVKILDYPPCGFKADRNDPQLCRDTAHTFRSGWQWSCAIHPAQTGRLSRCALAACIGCAPGKSRRHYACGHRAMAAGRDSAAVRQTAHGRDAAHKRITEMLARGEKLPPGVILPTDSSIMSGRLILCAMKSSAQPAHDRDAHG